MTHRTRSLVLYVLVALFFILGTAAVFYAQGWRARLSPFTFDKVGAIYLRTYPDDAEVFLDGRPKERNPGIFERGVLLGNVFPGRHTVEVRKAGSKEWRASFEVAPSRVTSHARVVLIPQEGVMATGTPVQDLKVFGGTIALETTSTVLALDGSALRGSHVVAGSSDGRYLITATATSSTYFWNDTESSTSTLLAAAFPRLALAAPATGRALASTTIEAVPETDLFLVAVPGSLRVLNSASGAVTTMTATSTNAIVSYALSPTRIAWSEYDPQKKASHISWYDLSSNTAFRDADAMPGKTRKATFAERATLLLLQDDGSLYSLSLSGGERVKIAAGVTDFKLAADGSRIAFADQEGVTVFSGSNGESYRFIRLDDAKDIVSLAWYKDNAHLFVAKGGTVFFLDLADSIEPSLTAVATTERFEYLPDANDLYFIADGKLLRAMFPD